MRTPTSCGYFARLPRSSVYATSIERAHALYGQFSGIFWMFVQDRLTVNYVTGLQHTRTHQQYFDPKLPQSPKLLTFALGNTLFQTDNDDLRSKSNVQ